MIIVRRDKEIYRAEGDWFSARWHFSFDQYRDPDNMGWGTLRVFNDDRLIPGAIWPLHPHRDIEGITYVVEGTFRHEDNVGGPPGPLPAGSVQRMTLGSGAWHSEQNASDTEPMRFIQMWIMPRERGLAPGVEQKMFRRAQRTDTLLEVISPEDDDAVLVHQDARVFVSAMTAGTEVARAFDDGFGAYLYVIEGDVAIADETLNTGDAAKIGGERHLRLRAQSPSELILVEIRLP